MSLPQSTIDEKDSFLAVFRMKVPYESEFDKAIHTFTMARQYVITPDMKLEKPMRPNDLIDFSWNGKDGIARVVSFKHCNVRNVVFNTTLTVEVDLEVVKWPV